MPKATPISLLTTLALPAIALAADPSITRLDGTRISAAQIDTTVIRTMQQAQTPGIPIALFNNGQIAYTKAYGERDQPAHKPLTADSVMTAASLTKPVFAV